MKYKDQFYTYISKGHHITGLLMNKQMEVMELASEV